MSACYCLVFHPLVALLALFPVVEYLIKYIYINDQSPVHLFARLSIYTRLVHQFLKYQSEIFPMSFFLQEVVGLSEPPISDYTSINLP